MARISVDVFSDGADAPYAHADNAAHDGPVLEFGDFPGVTIYATWEQALQLAASIEAAYAKSGRGVVAPSGRVFPEPTPEPHPVCTTCGQDLTGLGLHRRDLHFSTHNEGGRAVMA